MANLTSLGEPGHHGTRTLHNTVSHLKLKNLRQQPQYSDLVFVYKSQVEIYAHRAIVTQYSKYIHQLCTEKQSMEYIGSVNMVIIDLSVLLTPFSESLFYCVLDFIYGQSISIREEERGQLEQLATELEVWDLVSLLKIPANLWNSMSLVDQVGVQITDPCTADNLCNPIENVSRKVDDKHVGGRLSKDTTLPKLVAEEERAVMLGKPHEAEIVQQDQKLEELEPIPLQPNVERLQSIERTSSQYINSDSSIPDETHLNSPGVLSISNNGEPVSDGFNTVPNIPTCDNVNFSGSSVNTVNTQSSKANIAETSESSSVEDLTNTSELMKDVTVLSKDVSTKILEIDVDEENENITEHNQTLKNKPEFADPKGNNEAIETDKIHDKDKVVVKPHELIGNAASIQTMEVNNDGYTRTGNYCNTEIIDVDNIEKEKNTYSVNDSKNGALSKQVDTESEQVGTTMDNQNNSKQTVSNEVLKHDVNFEKSVTEEGNLGKPHIGQLIRSKRKRSKPIKYIEVPAHEASTKSQSAKLKAKKPTKARYHGDGVNSDTGLAHNHKDNDNSMTIDEETDFLSQATDEEMDLDVKQQRKPRKNLKLKCPKCPAIFPTREELYEHKIKDHQMYGCDLCKKVYETQELLNVHNHLHSSENPYIIVTAKGEKRYKCDLCSEQFKTSTHFFRHMQTSHNLEKPLRCPCCSTSCKYFSQFSKHMDLHTGEKNHSCPHCSAKFNNKYSMLRHLKIHTGEKPHLCDVCGKSFKDRQRLKEHRFIHGDVPKFSCDQCVQKFISPIYLQRHKKSHKKLYGCEKCGKRFGRLSHLRCHQRSHDGIKPYTCDTCGKMYSDPRPLRTHMAKVHAIEKDKIPSLSECRVDVRSNESKSMLETLVISEHEISDLLQNGNLVTFQTNATNIDVCQ